ncbi:NAD(P)-dependent alcohol dehydrogenase [Cryobacterium sp. TMT2-15-1]|uniref:NAD(P)-dependent alcohol dehydrogenase n=1 Tax=Cryobacterium sp. TMT2-15-1 TaxID=1259246 RepID=UPI00141B14D3|nr:NAD(P)-dependent alcohol dehydrogenase [Cryobacterium sp. TMT2-15-1]
MTNFRVADLVAGVSVTNFGAYAEYIVVPGDGVTAAKPSNLSDEEAVAVFDGSITALPFLRDAANLRPGQSVLINGASGAVGTAAIQLAKHYGATVTAVCKTANRALVSSLGADHVVDYATDDFTDNHDTYDAIFDAPRDAPIVVN